MPCFFSVVLISIALANQFEDPTALSVNSDSVSTSSFWEVAIPKWSGYEPIASGHTSFVGFAVFTYSGEHDELVDGVLKESKALLSPYFDRISVRKSGSKWDHESRTVIRYMFVKDSKVISVCFLTFVSSYIERGKTTIHWTIAEIPSLEDSGGRN